MGVITKEFRDFIEKEVFDEEVEKIEITVFDNRRYSKTIGMIYYKFFCDDIASTEETFYGYIFFNNNDESFSLNGYPENIGEVDIDSDKVKFFYLNYLNPDMYVTIATYHN